MYTKKIEETICWKCEHACATGKCPWATFGEPVPDWTAEKTTIFNKDPLVKNNTISSYKVISCPLYKQTTDYYECKSDIYKIISDRTGKSFSYLSHNTDIALKAFAIYEKKMPRSKEYTEEERNTCLKEVLTKVINKDKQEKRDAKRRLAREQRLEIAAVNKK